MPPRFRVVIAEDAAIMRDGLTQTLTRRGLDVVAAVADPGSLLQAVTDCRPDAAIIDVRMPPTYTDEGLRAALSVRRDHPGVGVLVFSQYIETRSAAELFAGTSGGVGYLLKDRVAYVSDFIDAIARVADGGTVLDPEVVRHLLSAGRRADALAALSPREREALSPIAQGRSNAAIASEFTISPRVVEKHVASIFAKLGLAPSDNDNRRSSPRSSTWSRNGSAIRVQVRLEYAEPVIEIDIIDDGHLAAGHGGYPAGHGLAGMRE